MPASTLTPAGRIAVRRASEDPIIAAAQRLKRYLPSTRFLGTNNRYSGDASNRLFMDRRRTPPRQVNEKHLCELLAASVPIHCLDGWGLLSGAVAAHLDGNPHSARHLAYYAELRATLALLASQGIGVFNWPHYSVDTSGSTHLITLSSQPGTHNAAWRCLAEWAKTSGSTAPIADVIRPEGLRIDEWLRLFTGGADPWKPLAEEWIRTLGVDVRRLSQDRSARNAASYRPTTLNSRVQLNATGAVEYVTAMWSALGYSSRSFDQLDLQFLRSSLRRAGEAAGMDNARFASAVDRAVEQAGVSAVRRPILTSFLTGAGGGGSRVIELARQLDGESAPGHHTQVISRALILLRLATGVSRRMLDRAGVAPSDYMFWWSSLASARGLAASLTDPDELADIWADIEASIQDLVGWLASGPDDYHSLRTYQGQATRNARSLELVGLQELIS